MEKTRSNTPVISVVIPCYNHAHFLHKAVESVLQQQYPALEVMVVDDGSTDTTREVAARYPQVRYIHQENQGLSAARNTGIRHSTGQYLAFLDADDWLYPGALETNLRHLQQHPKAALVSGAYDAIHVNENIIKEYIKKVESGHYCKLLSEGNYIGMIAAVLFRRWVFDEFLYNETLKSCEDYDLYLRIAHKYPVLHHTEKISAYRIHSFNMSHNIPVMLTTVLKVLKNQNVNSDAEKQALKRGQGYLIDLYLGYYYQKLRSETFPLTKEAFITFARYRFSFFYKYLTASIRPKIRNRISAYAPRVLKNMLRNRVKHRPTSLFL